jgi:hypothetical protein
MIFALLSPKHSETEQMPVHAPCGTPFSFQLRVTETCPLSFRTSRSWRFCTLRINKLCVISTRWSSGLARLLSISFVILNNLNIALIDDRSFGTERDHDLFHFFFHLVLVPLIQCEYLQSRNLKPANASNFVRASYSGEWCWVVCRNLCPRFGRSHCEAEARSLQGRPEGLVED